MKKLLLFGLSIIVCCACSPRDSRLAPYDLHGDVKSVSITTELRNGSSESRYLEFDKKGKFLHSENNLLKKEKLENGTLYVYNNQCGEDGEQWLYDNHNRLIVHSIPSWGDSERYEYNRNNLLIKKIESCEGNYGITEYVYDDDNMLTKTITYDGEEDGETLIPIESSKSIIQYIYISKDDKGNWTSRKVVSPNDGQYFENRDIIYWSDVVESESDNYKEDKKQKTSDKTPKKLSAIISQIIGTWYDTSVRDMPLEVVFSDDGIGRYRTRYQGGEWSSWENMSYRIDGNNIIVDGQDYYEYDEGQDEIIGDGVRLSRNKPSYYNKQAYHFDASGSVINYFRPSKTYENGNGTRISIFMNQVTVSGVGGMTIQQVSVLSTTQAILILKGMHNDQYRLLVDTGAETLTDMNDGQKFFLQN